ncbi:MAG: prenyltransferase/squalene oxidase repeat-containing protein, partial [Planctomycetaceae bacterium]
ASRRSSRIIVVVPPDDDSARSAVLSERIAKEMKTGGGGYLASLAFHAVLLLVLWMFIAPETFRLGGGGDAAFIELRLVDRDNDAGRDPKTPSERTFAFQNPVKTEPIRKPVPKPRKTEGQPAGKKPIGRPVKPVPVKALFRNRTPESRAKIFKEIDPQQKIRRAISGGLYWLKRQQQSAGNWRLHEGYPDPGYFGVRTDTGATALALLAFLGDGHTHRKAGVHREVVAKGLKWLVGIQKPNGDFHDHDDLGRQSAFYAHSQATIAVCEAYAMTGDESLRKPAEDAIRFLVKSQNPVRGGWKYQPQAPESQADLSVTGWALMALHSARAAGIDVPQQAFDLSARFLDAVQSNDGAHYRYEAKPGREPTVTMTAEGLLCRQFLGWEREHPALKKGVAYLMLPEQTPRWQSGGPARPHVYSWYYTGHVLHNLGGGDWKHWYAGVAAMIVTQQSQTLGRRNDVQGSWDPKVPRTRDYYGYGQYGGRLYMTAMCVLVLELPIRHRPVYDE